MWGGFKLSICHGRESREHHGKLQSTKPQMHSAVLHLYGALEWVCILQLQLDWGCPRSMAFYFVKAVGFRTTRLCKVFLHNDCFGQDSSFSNGPENVRWQSCKPKWDFLSLENSHWYSMSLMWYQMYPNDIRSPTRDYVFSKSPAKGRNKHFCSVKES